MSASLTLYINNNLTFLVVVCLLKGAINQDYVDIGILFIARGL